MGDFSSKNHISKMKSPRLATPTVLVTWVARLIGLGVPSQLESSFAKYLWLNQAALYCTLLKITFFDQSAKKIAFFVEFNIVDAT